MVCISTQRAEIKFSVTEILKSMILFGDRKRKNIFSKHVRVVRKIIIVVIISIRRTEMNGKGPQIDTVTSVVICVVIVQQN